MSKMISGAVALATVMLGVCTFGCSSSGGGGGAAPTDSGATSTDTATTSDGEPADAASDDGAPAGAEEQCRRAWTVTCAVWNDCQPATFAGSFGDVAACVATGTAHCVATFGAFPHAPWDTTKEKTCADELNTEFTGPARCDDYFQFYGWSGDNALPPAACYSKGLGATGDACTYGGECAGEYCDVVPGKFCGTCKDRVPLGGTCSAAKPGLCAFGSICAGGKCVAYGSLGSACDDTLPCHGALMCGADGKCTQRLAIGETCSNTGGDTGCALGLSCNRVTNKCEPWATAKLGEACANSDKTNTLTACEFGAKCKVTNTTTFLGTCVPAKKLGEACSFSGPFEDECAYPNRCQGKVCAPITAASCGG